jgi:hypothetical protein
MFAPKVAKPQTKAAASTTSKLASRRSRPDVGNAAEQADLRQRATGNRAAWDFSQIPVSAPDRPNGRQPAPPPGIAQPKLVVSERDDPLEHEAARVADQVMRTPKPALSVAAVHPQISRKYAGSEAAAQTSRLSTARPSETGVGEAGVAEALVDDVLRTPGQALDSATRAVFEPRFGHDFSQVRVHADERASRSAQAVDAEAYTAGLHIAFASNRYAPQTPAGQHLLAHELAHVVQQRFLPGSSLNTRFPGFVSLQRQATGASAQPAQSLPNVAPGLGQKQAQDIDTMIKAGNFQGAVDMVVFYAGGGIAKNYSIDESLLADGKMTFDAGVTWADATTNMASWDYINNKADPAKVRIGPGAFSSVAYLYSVIMHEYQHVLFRQSLPNQQISHQAKGHGGMDTDEVEASAWEILHAGETGLDRLPDKIAHVWSTLNDEFWQLDPAAQNKSRPLATRAFQEAQRMVKASKVSLDPFKRP